MKNEEIQHIVQILGLRFGVKYDSSNVKTLRYGHLMIMTDQDHDGACLSARRRGPHVGPLALARPFEHSSQKKR